MPGVIALLPEPFAARVEALWDRIERDFEVPRGYPGAIPHLTFHLGTHDIDAGADEVVRRVAARTAPFSVHSAGLGVFSGSPPVIHIMVARSPATAALAQTLETELAAAGYPATDPYFAPTSGSRTSPSPIATSRASTSRRSWHRTQASTSHVRSR